MTAEVYGATQWLRPFQFRNGSSSVDREAGDGERQQGVWEEEQEAAKRRTGEGKGQIRGSQIGHTLSKIHRHPGELEVYC